MTQQKSWPRSNRTARLVLCAGVLTVSGGCTDVRNGLVDAFQAATVVALTDRSAPDAVTTLQNNLMQTLVGLFYDKLRIQRVQP